MSRPRNVRRVLGALVPVLSLAVGATFAGALPSTAAGQTAAAATSAVPPATKGATIDWFDAKFAAVAPGSVFETATLERFEYLLKKPGKFAFVIGGPQDATLQNALGHIDAVAKANGITKVYNFDPRLDGKDLDVFDRPPRALRREARPSSASTAPRLVDDYLGKDAETPFTPDPAAPDPLPLRATTAPAATPTGSRPPSPPRSPRPTSTRLLRSPPTGRTSPRSSARPAPRRRHPVRLPQRRAQPAPLRALRQNVTRRSSDQPRLRRRHLRRLATAARRGIPHRDRSPTRSCCTSCSSQATSSCSSAAPGATTPRRSSRTTNDAREHGIEKVYNFDFSCPRRPPANGSGSLRTSATTRSASAEAVKQPPVAPLRRPRQRYLTNAVTQYRKTGDPGAGGVNPVSLLPAAGTRPTPAGRGPQDPGRPPADLQQGPRSPRAARRRSSTRRSAERRRDLHRVHDRVVVRQGSGPSGRSDTTLIGNAPSASEANLDAMENQRAFAKEGIGRRRDVLAILGGGRAQRRVGDAVIGRARRRHAGAGECAAPRLQRLPLAGARRTRAPPRRARSTTKTVGSSVREGATVLASARPGGRGGRDQPPRPGGRQPLADVPLQRLRRRHRPRSPHRHPAGDRRRRSRRRGCVDHRRQRPLHHARQGRHGHSLR